MARLLLVAATVLVAGCAADAPPPEAGAQLLPPTELPPLPDSYRIRSVEPVNQSVTLLADPVDLQLSVPAGALDVSFYLTVEESASVGLRGDLEGCVREEQGAVFAGQTLGMSCGALSEGARLLRVSHAPGRAVVRVVVNATVQPCQAEPGGCARAPGISSG